MSRSAQRKIPAMPTVRTTCPTCDTVLIDAGALTVRCRPEADRTECCFICPDCVQPVVQPVSDKMVPVLIGAGCMVEYWGDAYAGSLYPSGVGITESEVRDFVSALERDDWFGELLS
jgi:hypothetical protein